LPVIQDARFALDCALHGAMFTYCRGTMAYYRIHSHHSLSRRDPAAFIADCFRSAREVEEWFQEHGGITTKRRAALIKVFEQVARATYENNPDTFEAAFEALERLSPGGYVPSHQNILRSRRKSSVIGALKRWRSRIARARRCSKPPREGNVLTDERHGFHGITWVSLPQSKLCSIATEFTRDAGLPG
jgi:hypothetical protein